MSDASEVARELDENIRRIAARFEAYISPSNQVLSEATEAENLEEAKEAFDEEIHQYRLSVIRERLKLEKRDCWLRPSAYYWMGLAKY